MYELTKMDVAAIRACDSLTVRYSSTDGATVWVEKEIPKTPANPFAQNATHALDAPVSVYVYRGEDTSQWRAYGHTRIYRGQRCEARSALATLRVGDRISFEFAAGAHSTDAILAAGFYGDVLRLIVRRKGQTDYQLDDQFTITSRVGTACHRMVMGLIPRPERATA